MEAVKERIDTVLNRLSGEHLFRVSDYVQRLEEAEETLTPGEVAILQKAKKEKSKWFPATDLELFLEN